MVLVEVEEVVVQLLLEHDQHQVEILEEQEQQQKLQLVQSLILEVVVDQVVLQEE